MTPRRAVVSLDGCGVIQDAVLVREGGPFAPDGSASARLRVHLTDDPGGDVSVYVEDGALHVVGQYGTVQAEQEAANHVVLRCEAP